MSLMKWDPFKELEDVSARLNRFFGRSSAPVESSQEMLSVADWTPSVDISETDTAYLIKGEIPGVKKEDVKVTIQDGMLNIVGERKMEKEEKERKYHRIERSYGSFMRSFRVPSDADDSAVKAEFKDGVLNVTLPKSSSAKRKAIEVAVS
jgi:HSP20 family protein